MVLCELIKILDARELIGQVCTNLGIRRETPWAQQAVDAIHALTDHVHSGRCQQSNGIVLVAYHGYREGMPCHFADAFSKEVLLNEFSEIPTWNNLVADWIPYEIPSNKLHISSLSLDELIAEADHSSQLPVPLSWSSDNFDTILSAEVFSAGADCQPQALTASIVTQYLHRLGIGCAGSGGLCYLDGGTLRIPCSPEEAAVDEEILDFKDEIFNRISLYHQLRLCHKWLVCLNDPDSFRNLSSVMRDYFCDGMR